MNVPSDPGLISRNFMRTYEVAVFADALENAKLSGLRAQFTMLVSKAAQLARRNHDPRWRENTIGFRSEEVVIAPSKACNTDAWVDFVGSH